jgi:predicted nucleic acid-binding protein
MPDPAQLVVVNATPIISLALINQLPLLQALYGEVHIPPAVRTEVLAGGARASGVAELQTSAWIRTTPLADPRRADLLSDLDRGEAEVIALAQELNASLVIIDERLARLVTRRLNIPLTGTIGVLLRAKTNGLLPAIAPLLRTLQQSGIRLGPELVAEAIRLACGAESSSRTPNCRGRLSSIPGRFGWVKPPGFKTAKTRRAQSFSSFLSFFFLGVLCAFAVFFFRLFFLLLRHSSKIEQQQPPQQLLFHPVREGVAALFALPPKGVIQRDFPGPAVGGQHGVIHLHVELAQPGDGRRRFAGIVEAVVGGGQPFLPGEHQLAAVFVVRFAEGFELGECGGLGGWGDWGRGRSRSSRWVSNVVTL